MGDRAVVVFAADDVDHVAVYTHHGGRDIADAVEAFFADEQSNLLHDNRFDDAEYLAARFVVWASGSTGTGVGIVPAERREATNVQVHCDNDRPPRVEVIER